MAVNCWLVFTGIDEAAGATTIEVRFAAACVTVKLALAFSVPDCAEMVVAPEVEPVASPAELMPATFASVEPQVTDAVISCVVPFERYPVALNCCVAPMPMAEELGEILIDVTVGLELLEDEPPELICEFPPPPFEPPQAVSAAIRASSIVQRRVFMQISVGSSLRGSENSGELLTRGIVADSLSGSFHFEHNKGNRSNPE